MDKILKYIGNNWNGTCRLNTVNNGILLALPFEYTVPCIKGTFQELYYWDTYFACRDLTLQHRHDLVKNNCDNFIYQTNKYGFVPNGNRSYYLSRSQPPFL